MSAQSTAPEAPATMTVAGRRFLSALASRANDGCFLEIGPLFGSSTQSIAAGRRSGAPIHTIDTFAPAPWIVRRLGENLSRAAFDRYTQHIPDLVVHQGFAPDVVRDSWTERIGFYFDDATHGDPGWTNNFNFFQHFFTEDAIVCGDDFAGGWPDIPRNVTRIADDWGAGLYVMGRVWAITRHDEGRLAAAATAVCPELQDAVLDTAHGSVERSMPAMCWSRGLHQHTALDAVRMRGEALDDVRLTIRTRPTAGRPADEREYVGGQWATFDGASEVSVTGPQNLGVQLCLSNGSKTENTRLAKRGLTLEVPEGSRVVSIRLGSI